MECWPFWVSMALPVMWAYLVCSGSQQDPTNSGYVKYFQMGLELCLPFPRSEGGGFLYLGKLLV